MLSLAILVVCVVGQSNCQGGACLPLEQMPTSVVSYAHIPLLAKHWVKHNGGEIVVEGWQFEEGGRITWECDRPFNVQAVRRFQETKTKAKEVEVKAMEAAVEPPTKEETVVDSQAHAINKRNFGLKTEFMGGRPGHYTTANAEGRRFVQEAKDAPAAAKTAKVHVTVIGSAEEQKKVLEDLEHHPSLAPLRGLIHVQGYLPAEWAVDPALGFQAGKPTIMIQSGKTATEKGGKVLWRARDYSGGAEKLAEEIRRANPSYKPELDPGIVQAPGECPLGFTAKHYLPIGIAIAIVLWIFNKKGTARA